MGLPEGIASEVQIMTVSSSLLMAFILSATSARNVTVCVIQQENYNTGSPDSELERWTEVDSLLRSRLTDKNVSVTLERHVIPAAQFPWFSLSACTELNPSCSGVVTIAQCHHAQYIDSWAEDQVIPSTILTDRACKMTSSHSVTVMTQSRFEPVLLQQLLTRLEWNQVAMLVDSASIAAVSTSDLVKRLSDVYLGSLMFRLFDVPSNDTMTPSEIMRQNLQTVKKSHFFNILVIASHHSAEVILTEARRSGLLSRQYFWLVLLPDGQCSDILRLVAGNETNVLLVQPVASGMDPSQSCSYVTHTCQNTSFHHKSDVKPIVSILEAVVRTAPDEGSRAAVNSTAGDICTNRHKDPGRQAAIRDHISKVSMLQLVDNALLHDGGGQTSGAAAHSICSTDSSQTSGVAYVGKWTVDGGLELQDEHDKLYRNTFRDFGYRTLRIGTQEAKPFVQEKFVNGKKTFEGFCIDILTELARKLKFRYEFVEPPDNEWGAPSKNGTGWTGIVGMVMNKEVDIGVGPITITSIREEVIDFTKPFMEDGIGILTKRPNSDAKNMFKMFTPLTPQVWGAVAGCIVLVSICLYGIERLSPFSARNLTGDRKLGPLGCIWLIYGSYMEQGGDPHPRSVSARCLVGFWWLFTILMTSTYTANLAAFLTVTIQDTPINSLIELAQSPDLKPLVKTGSNIHTLFMEAEGGVYRDIWRKMDGMPKVTSNDAALSHVLTGSHAYMTDASQLEYIMLKDCTTYSLAKEIFNTGGFGFVLQEDAPYMDVINYNIMKMHEAGLVDKWRQRWWSSPDPCTTSDRTSAAKQLDWSSLSGLFYIFLGVASASVLFRALEFWVQGEKISRFWFRLKSKVMFAATADNTTTNSHTSASTTTRSNSTRQNRAVNYSVNSRPSLRSQDTGSSAERQGSREDDSRSGMDGFSYEYSNGSVGGETGVFFLGNESERTGSGWTNQGYAASVGSGADSSSDEGQRRRSSSHRKSHKAHRKDSQDNRL